MRQSGLIESRAEFYSPDGTRYSMGSLMKEVMQMPFFRMRIDGGLQEYHVHSSRAFNMTLSVATPNEKSLQKFGETNYDIAKLKARVSS